MELLIWKIIGYGFLFFIGIGIVFGIIQILTPFIFIALTFIACATYPFVLLVRLLGFKNCPSLFPIWHALFGVHFLQENQTSQQNETNNQQSYKGERELKAKQKESPFDPWVILEVPRNASRQEIRAAYKSKIVLNHPDKVASLDPALQTFATQRTVLLQKAYEQLIGAA